MSFNSVFPVGVDFVLEIAEVDSFAVAEDGEFVLGERYFAVWISETD